jgi:hypothetical protein
MRKLLAVAVAMLLIPQATVSAAYAASTVKYTNQKAGQFCKNLEVGKFVVLPSGSKLKCVSLTNAKPRWRVSLVAPISSPTPTKSAVPKDPLACTPKSLPALPFASQRMSILKMEWKKDSAGYVTALLTIRNDNSMNLRVVQYQFFYWYGSERRTTAFEYQSTYGMNTVEHVFSKDTEKLMGVDNTPGAWLAGQSRTFLIDTAKILDCALISVFDSDFNVIQGIGDGP